MTIVGWLLAIFFVGFILLFAVSIWALVDAVMMFTGSVRDSLSVLGQLIAGVGDEGLTYATAVSALGLTDASLIDGFVAATTRGSAAEMFTLVDEVVSAGHDPRRFVADLLDRLRDLIILRADPAAAGRGQSARARRAPKSAN